MEGVLLEKISVRIDLRLVRVLIIQRILVRSLVEMEGYLKQRRNEMMGMEMVVMDVIVLERLKMGLYVLVGQFLHQRLENNEQMDILQMKTRMNEYLYVEMA